MAERATRDRDRENIDSADTNGLRRSRAPNHRDVLDIMQGTAVSSLKGLTDVFKRQVDDNAAALNDPAVRRSNRITDLYKRRKLAVKAGRQAAVARNDAMIYALEEEEKGDEAEQQDTATQQNAEPEVQVLEDEEEPEIVD